ncbi:MAG: glycoside hydrolase family 15 protein [Deltaproteobacteria bacterium]|nr:MAG: glycoside hydrolase family 15 protein [Deltaproteobacteria bacterium]
MSARIGDYAIVGDCRSAALISRGGSLDWLCWPHFDSPSLFAAILDERRGGRFLIAPSGTFRSERSYAGESNVLVTRFLTAGGEVELTDFMPVLEEQEAKSVLRPQHELLRIARCTRGEVEIEIVFDPRPCYATIEPRIESMGKLGLRIQLPGSGLLTLRTDAPLGEGGRARVTMRAGDELQFSLSLARRQPAVLVPFGERGRWMQERSIALWQKWARQTQYDGPWRDAVVRSALVLKLLQYAPSGAIVAAPTTSLPERPGGDLNWDYRFCWLRDAALTTRALYGLGHHDEAENFMSWLLSATNLSLPKLHVLYELFGRKPGRERTLPHLSGHAGARPVHIGNAAVGQVQLDTYGEVIEAVAHSVRCGGKIDNAIARMLIGFGREVARDWDDPDEGIWEIRGYGRNFVHSRALCWSALQRLIDLNQQGHLPKAPVDEFRKARNAVREEIETLGWSEELQTYTRTLAGGDVDASLLLLPWYGYCAPDSPRMLATWRRIRERLDAGGGLLRRYHGRLTAGEGAFGICSFWAAEYLALGGGPVAEAEEHFETLLRYANDVGLYAEEIEVSTGHALGNFPQAYTHVGLINAALTLRERVERGKSALQRERQEMIPEARA